MILDSRLNELKDKEAVLSAIFLTSRFPKFKESIIQCILTKSEYDSITSEINKLITTELKPKDREKLELTIEEYSSLWFKLAEVSQYFTAYSLTHKRFTNKRQERLDLAVKNLEPSAKDLALELLEQMKDREESLEQLNLNPTKIMKKKTERNKITIEYQKLLNKLEGDFIKLGETLTERCPFLYRGLNA